MRNEYDRITFNPAILGGKPIVRGDANSSGVDPENASNEDTLASNPPRAQYKSPDDRVEASCD